MRPINGHPIGVATKVVYGVGALSDSIKTFSFTTFLLFYYTTVLGLPGSLLGLAMSVGLVWDAAVDPLIGHMSDRATLKFGRRHSFMAIGAVCAGASFIAVFNPPSGLSTAALFAWLMVSSLCLRSSNSLFMVPYFALGAELTNDYHERTSIAGYRIGAVLTGTLLAMAAAFLVFLPTGSTSASDAKFTVEGYQSIGLAFGLAMTVTALIATLGTLGERARLVVPSVDRSDAQGLSRTLLDALRDGSFRVLLVSSAIAAMAGAINAALGLHFLTYHARIGASQAMTLYFGGFFAGALAGVFMWVRVARKIEKQHVYAATMLATAFVISTGYWLVGEGRLFGTGQLPILVALSGLAGFFGIGPGVIGPSMMADITTHDQLRTGHRRDGAFFGMYSFGQQVSSGLAVLIAGVLVDVFAGLVPARAQQSAATVERLVMISNVLPAIMFAGAGVIALRYRLTRLAVESVPPDVLSHGSGVASIPGTLYAVGGPQSDL
jgi:GPH family glycoside/pentoside/hexuronide:cation symporter